MFHTGHFLAKVSQEMLYELTGAPRSCVASRADLGAAETVAIPFVTFSLRVAAVASYDSCSASCDIRKTACPLPEELRCHQARKSRLPVTWLPVLD